MKKSFSHLDKTGSIKMVDVSEKEPTKRTAVAEAVVKMSSDTFRKVHDTGSKKGDLFSTVKITGIQAVKKTSNLIPLCHPLAVENINIEIEPDADNSQFVIHVSVFYNGKTGVEMEALTGAAVSALTFYDMCKSLDKSIEILNIRLIKKTGGKSGTYSVKGKL
ncbi:cyclic pyranopterin monophosphate synthase MoaC [candidate division KSB1 bacterium]